MRSDLGLIAWFTNVQCVPERELCDLGQPWISIGKELEKQTEWSALRWEAEVRKVVPNAVLFNSAISAAEKASGRASVAAVERVLPNQ